MKKKFCFLLAFGICVSAAFSQELFTVIKVNGNIVIERTGSSLGIGTSFLQNENLLFRIPESRAAVINPRLGRFLITSETVKEFQSAKSNFLPPSTKISTRSVVSSTGGKAVESQFGSTYPVPKEIKVVVDTEAYPLRKTRYFYISYDLNDKAINKKLPFSSDTLYIRQTELLTVNGKILIKPDIKLMKLIYYTEGSTYTSKPLLSFSPTFPDTDSLKMEIRIILDKLEMNPYNDKFETVKAFIRDFYGEMGDESLKLWLRDNLGISE